jgi:alanyl-tRNA synthetase
LGDFFKKESIKFSFELLTEVLKIDKRKIAVTVFE